MIIKGPPETFDEDIELYEDHCPECGGLMYRQDCDAIGCGGEGYYDGNEDDPLWYDLGDTVTCQECNGSGHFIWCEECGYSPYQEQRVEG